MEIHRQMRELAQDIYIKTAWGASKETINSLIRQYNELAREANKDCKYEWAKYEYKEQLI